MFLRMILLISLISGNVYAEDPTYINKDEKAPYNGLLFSENKAKEIRKELIDKDATEALNVSLKKTNDLYKTTNEIKDSQINILLEQNDKLAKTAYEARKMNNWEKAGYFIGGMIVVGLAIEGVKALK